MKKLIFLFVMMCMLVAGVGNIQASEEKSMDVRKELLERVALYAESINRAEDTTLAGQVWATTPQSSFIHPRGHEFGWQEIKDNLYTGTMAGMFSRRELKVVGSPVIQVHGDAAVVEFEWEFTATVRKDGSQRHSRGRESQVYVKQPEKGWCLVHVHYSEPVAPRGQ